MWRFLIFSLLAATGLAQAQAQPAEPVKRTPLQKVKLADGKSMAVMVLIEVAPDAVIERHTHHGIEMVYVIEGAISLDVAGQPSRMLKAGDSAVNPAGAAHGGKAGPAGARLTGTFIVDKDKPLATPAR